MEQQGSLFGSSRHSHLRLATAIGPGVRRARAPGFGGSVYYQNRRTHGEDVHRQISKVRDEHARRAATAGVDPDLILVLETNRPLDPGVVEAAGLTVLEVRSDTALIAFASDPELTEFQRRNLQYQEGPQGLTDNGNERGARYQALFDYIDEVRGIEVRDVRGAALVELLDSTPLRAGSTRLEIHCWCSEDPSTSRARNASVSAAVKELGGQVLHTSVRVNAGWSVLCCDIPNDTIEAVTSLPHISWADLMPNPQLNYLDLLATTAGTLPGAVAPSQDAPIVAVIDSGIRSAHPLLSPAVAGVEWVGPGLGDGGDHHGHGTFVASLALYGSLEGLLEDGGPLVPAGRLLSVRVLDESNRFPDDRVWAETLIEAMQVAVDVGARVINVSVADDRAPYTPRRPTPVGAMVDAFVRENPTVVVVTCTGNFPIDAHDIDRLIANTYPEDLLASASSGLLDPGTAALALTVGSLCGDEEQGAAFRVSAETAHVGGPRRPSPMSRIGPGPMGAVKPELVAPGGSVSVDTLVGRVMVAERATQVVGAGAEAPDRLLAVGSGTSYAAPLVAHAALRVVARYPLLSGSAIRALLLVAAEELPELFATSTPADRKNQRRLVGYGRVSASRAELSDDHRVVLLSEGSLVVDQVHFYRVGMPSSFFESGGECRVRVALAYDPPVRVTRLDYLANRMSFQVFHGASLEDVRSSYVKSDESGELQDDVAAAPAELDSLRLDLQPPDQDRSRGTNQFGSYRRGRRFDPAKGGQLIVAVRNMKRWDTPGVTQAYALAVQLERDPDHPAIYAELEAELEPLVEITLAAEVEF